LARAAAAAETVESALRETGKFQLCLLVLLLRSTMVKPSSSTLGAAGALPPWCAAAAARVPAAAVGGVTFSGSFRLRTPPLVLLAPLTFEFGLS